MTNTSESLTEWINQIIQGKCEEIMQKIPDNFIDAVITDPPYELGFMGKKWDNTGIAYDVDMWREVLRVLKPGGYLLSFGGTRTYHRMACAIEDAGFEIRDQMQWIYGSGFPKSMDISKAIDNAAGADRGIIEQGATVRRIRPGCDQNKSGSWEKLTDRTYTHFVTAPATPEAQQWDGWGTALKPANEPIVLARKPLDGKTVVENVFKWGTGGINIDGCRVPTREDLRGGAGGLLSHVRDSKDYPKENRYQPSKQGRFPANVILDEEAGRILDEQTGVLRSGDNCRRTKAGSFLEHGGLGKAGDIQTTYGDQGGASRFFYCAKASRKERGESKHPTVKPLSLMRYLCRLITSSKGIIFDPFAGSGTTLEAAILEGFSFVGIEREQEYIIDIHARIKRAKEQMQGGLFGGETT